MIHAADAAAAHQENVTQTVSRAADARDLQSRLYREIGISAVAAALRFACQPDPDKAVRTVHHEVPAMFRDEHLAA